MRPTLSVFAALIVAASTAACGAGRSSLEEDDASASSPAADGGLPSVDAGQALPDAGEAEAGLPIFDGGVDAGDPDAGSDPDAGMPDPCEGVLCSSPDACNLSVCDPATGQCGDVYAVAGTTCDDGDPCTFDKCDGQGSCRTQPVECSAGICHTAVCNPLTGACDPSPMPDGTPCGQFCAPGATCTAGQCAGAPTPPSEPFWRASADIISPLVFRTPEGARRTFSTAQWSWLSCSATLKSTSLYLDTYDPTGNLTRVYWGSSMGVSHAAQTPDGMLIVTGVDTTGGYWSPFVLATDASGYPLDLVAPDPHFPDTFTVDGKGRVVWLTSTPSGLIVERTPGEWTWTWLGYFKDSGSDWKLTLPGHGSVSLAAMDDAGHTFVFVHLSSGDLTVDGDAMAPPDTNAVLILIDNFGRPVWHYKLAGPGSIGGSNLVADASGNVYVVGSFNGTVDLGTGPLTAAGVSDGFILAFGLNGELLWSDVVSSAGRDSVGSVALGPGGTIHVTGNFGDATTLGGGAFSLPSDDGGFLAEYDAATGALQTARTYDTSSPSGLGLLVDCANRVTLSGYAPGFRMTDSAVPLRNGLIMKLGDVPSDCGTGLCQGSQYCDDCGCRPVSDPMSELACVCGDLDAANGVGDCADAVYCDRGSTSSATCYAEGSGATFALCSGGDLTAQCLPNVPVKHVFATSQAFSSVMGGVAGADASCQSLAEAAGHTGTFKAWLSADQAASVRISHDAFARYELFDGTVVATNWEDLLDGSLQHAIDLTEQGTQPPAVAVNSVQRAVWTGTTDTGDYAGDWDSLAGGSFICHELFICPWDQISPGQKSLIGDMVAGPGWSEASMLSCSANVALPIYCFESD